MRCREKNKSKQAMYLQMLIKQFAVHISRSSFQIDLVRKLNSVRAIISRLENEHLYFHNSTVAWLASEFYLPFNILRF